jgi:VWFA-related protein
MTAKRLIVAALFLFAVIWVSLMGLLSHVGAGVRESLGVGAAAGGPYTDDGSIKAEITSITNDKFKITVTLKVTDRDGKVLGGVDPAQFEIVEDDRLASVQGFFPAGQAPVRVCVVMDYSSSMKQGKKWEKAKAAALALLEKLRDGTDHFGLYFFNGSLIKQGAEERLAMGKLDAPRRAMAQDAINNTPLSGGTPMYACMDRAFTALKSGSGRRVMVVLTDGQDTQFKGKKQDEQIDILSGHARDMGVPVYMISMEGGKSDDKGMQKMADKSNGKFYSIDPANPASLDKLKDIYVSIGDSLRDEYVLEYQSPNPREDGSIRPVVVTVRNGPVGTKARSSYHVPGLLATGAGSVPANPDAAGDAAGDAPPSLALIFFPLVLMLATAFAVPYFFWLRPRGTAAAETGPTVAPVSPAAVDPAIVPRPRRPQPPPGQSGPEPKLW